MEKISVIINTYNASMHLEEILDYLKDFDEVVICDMESTDNTREIAEKKGCRVEIFPRGEIRICEPARNFAIQSAKNEWVLIVDADEIIPKALSDYLHEYVNSGHSADALRICRRNLFIEDKPSVVYPDYQCRLVKKSKCYWPPTIHSVPQINGRTESIDKNRHELAMIHKPEKFSDYVHKHFCTYTDNETIRRWEKGKKITLLQLIFAPAFRFFKRYILKGAIFHGKTGYIESQSDAIYKFITLSKLYEKQLKEEKERQVESTQ